MRYFRLAGIVLFLAVVVTALVFAQDETQSVGQYRGSTPSSVAQWRAMKSASALKNLAPDDNINTTLPMYRKMINGTLRSDLGFTMPTHRKATGAVINDLSPMNGSYTFATLDDAANNLQSRGVTGNVTVYISPVGGDTMCSDPVIINGIPGVGPGAVVTITAAAGHNVFIKFKPVPMIPWGLVFASAQYVTIDGTAGGGTLHLGWCIEDPAVNLGIVTHPRAATVALMGFTDHIQVNNCIITSIAWDGASNTAPWMEVEDARHGIVLLNTEVPASKITDVTIKGNSFGRCFYGIVSIVPWDGDDGAATFTPMLATVERIHILGNKFGTALTGEDPCAQAISVGGYTEYYGQLIGGNGIEVADNQSEGDVFTTDLFVAYSGLFEGLYWGGLASPIDILVSGASNTSVDTSTFVRNVVANYQVLMGPVMGGWGDIYYSMSVRGGGCRAFDNVSWGCRTDDPYTSGTYEIRAEGCHWIHNTSVVVQRIAGNAYAGRMRSGSTYRDNIFYSNLPSTTGNRVFRWDGGTGTGNVFGATLTTVTLWRNGNTGTNYNYSTFYNVPRNGWDICSDPWAGGNPGFNSLLTPITMTDFLSQAKLHIDSGATTPVEGKSPKGDHTYLGMAVDYWGNPRPDNPPARDDAGAQEVKDGVPALNNNLLVQAIINPNPLGTPQALPTHLTALVKNVDGVPRAFDLRFRVTNSLSVVVFDSTISGISGPAHSVDTVDFGTWAPADANNHTVKATITAGGGSVAGDDELSRTQPIVPIVSTYPQTYDWETDAQGWIGTGSWAWGGFAKLGGPFSGTKAWVTGLDVQYSNATLHALYSPYFNTTGLTHLYVNFYQSLMIEPAWDRSALQYSVDTGKTWKFVDPREGSINWYSNPPYENACLTSSAWYDEATAKGFGLPADPWCGWASNGSGAGAEVITGPYGYIFVQNELDPDSCLNKPMLRLRYILFADAATNNGGGTENGQDDPAKCGVAIDKFIISGTPNADLGSIAGMVYGDGNGNGSLDAWELGRDGDSVFISGAASDTEVTSGGGVFSFPGLKAGAYTVTVKRPAGYSITEPPAQKYVEVLGPGTNVTGLRIGLWEGGISGLKYEDKNHNGAKEAGEPGFPGVKIRAIADADLWAFKQARAKEDAAAIDAMTIISTTTDPDGNYFLSLPAGTYIIAEDLATTYVNTEPGLVDTTLVDNGDGTFSTKDVYGYYAGVMIDSANPAIAKTFGNYKYGKITLNCFVDQNGNGVQDPEDQTAMGLLEFAYFTMYKNGVVTDHFVLGDGAGTKPIEGLDIGAYKITFDSAASNYTRTKKNAFVGTILVSGDEKTATFLVYKNYLVLGYKYEDHDGNGVKDLGDGPLAGFTIQLDGGAQSMVTGGDGAFLFTNVGPGDHTISEVVNPGWMRTLPADPGTYTINQPSGTNIIIDGPVFLNFKNVTISGMKYKDQNMNGTKDSWEVPEAWTAGVALDGGTPVPIGSDGLYSFTNVGPGTHTIAEVADPAWTQTEPTGDGKWHITVSSGVNVTGKNFGNYKLGDSTKFRTFASDDWVPAATKKAIKKPKPGKPGNGVPNLVNAMNELFLQLGKKQTELHVGISGLMFPDGKKEKPSIYPQSAKDVFATFADKKGNEHADTIFRGLDFYNGGTKLIVKKLKSMPPTKQNNDCVEDMMGLACNIVLSDHGLTQLGLGDLVYSNPGNVFDGKTVRQIKAMGDDMMTNWGSYLYADYKNLSDVVSSINNAFSCGPPTFDCETEVPLDTVYWMGHTYMLIKSLYSVADVPFLHTNPSAPPITLPNEPPPSLPEVYALGQNYPNPFNPTTTISFDLPNDAIVTLTVYNLLGQEVARLVDNELIGAGTEEVDFDASMLSSGVYLYRIDAQPVNDDGITTGESFTQVKKMMLMK